MKKLSLFIFLTMLGLFGSSAWVTAQTDVTSTYLTNAGFETSPTGVTDNTVSDVPGWTEVPTAGAAQYYKLGTVGYETNTGDAVGTVPSNGSSVTENNSSLLAIKLHWSPSVDIYVEQEVELLAGVYSISWDAFVAQTVSNQESRCGIVIGESAIYDPLPSSINTWKTHLLVFTLVEQTAVKIRMGYNKTANTGGGSSPILFVDNVKLYSGIYKADLQADLQEKINEANTLYGDGSGNNASDLNTAIGVAQTALTNTAATREQITTAISDLETAIWNYKYANASEENPLDMTSFIVNPTFDSDANGWTSNTGASSNKTATNQAGDFTTPFWENWNGSAFTGKMYQTVSGLPNGKYTLRAAVFTETQKTTDGDWLYLYGGNAKTAVTTTAPTFYSVEGIVVTTKTLEIGIEMTEAVSRWVGIDNFRLYYHGPVDLSQFETALTALITDIEAADFNKPMSVAAAAELTAALADAKAALADDARTEASLTEASTRLASAKDAANASISAYVPLAAIIARMEAILPHYTLLPGKATFEAAVAAVKAGYTEGTYEEGEDTIAIQSLKAAELTCLADAMDVTEKIANPTFDSNKDGWTSTTGAQNNTVTDNKQGDFTGNFWENWNGSAYSGKMYQAVSNLDNGKYILRAAVFTSTQADHDWLYLYAGDYRTAVQTTDPTFHSVGAFVTNGELEIGLDITEAVTTWVGLDNFSLYYLGVDLDALKADLEALITAAGTYTESKMQTAAATELAGAITQAQAAVQASPLVEADLNAATVRLNTATAAAAASIAAYASLNEAIIAANATKTEYAEYAGYTTFETAIAAAAAAYETAALDNDGVTAAIDALEAAELACRLSQGTPFDATFAIKNPSFEAESHNIASGINIPDGWEVEHQLTSGDVILNTTDNPIDGEKLFNAWSATFTGFDLYQSINLSAGQYTLSAAMRTQHAEQISDQHIYAKVGEDSIPSAILTLSPEVVEADDWKKVEAWQTLTVTFNVPDGGSAVRIGAASTGGASSLGWFQLDHFQLNANGNFNAAIAALQDSVDIARELTGQMQTAVRTELDAAIAEANTALETPSETVLQTATTRLTAAIAAARSSIAAYAALRATIEGVNSRKAAYTDYPGYPALTAAISAAMSVYNGRTADEAAIAEAIAALEAAEEACIATGVHNPGTDAIVIYGEKNALRIQSSDSGTVTIYGANGQLVKTGVIAKGTTLVPLTSGAYIVNGKKIVVK
jgi:hypothetical protein